MVSKELYSSDNFEVKIRLGEGRVELVHRIKHPLIHTSALPITEAFLAQEIASIFGNQCFNGKNKSFRAEASSTEIGHLFEHLILEYIKLLAEKVYGGVCVSGETIWNWKEMGYGTFLIKIDFGQNYRGCIEDAILNAAKLLDKLYELHDIRLSQGRQIPALGDNLNQAVYSLFYLSQWSLHTHSVISFCFI